MSIFNSTSSGYSGKSNNNRILGFDIAKSLAMFFVVLLHASFYTGIIHDSLFSRVMMSFTVICVPLFMAVNGAILLNKHFIFKRHLKKLFGIILLLIIWRLLHIIGYAISGSPKLSILQFCAILLGDTSVDGYLMGHFWFLEALASIYFIFPLLKIAYDYEDKKPMLLMLSILLLLTFGLDSVRCILEVFFGERGLKVSELIKPLSNLNIFGPFGYLLVYFISGGFCASFWSKKGNSYFFEKLPLILTVFLISLFCTSSLHELQYSNAIAGPFSTPYGYWLPSTFFSTLSALCLCLIVGNCCHSERISNLFIILGSNTLGVYFLHMFGIILLRYIQNNTSGGFVPSYMTNAANSICFAAVILLLYLLLSFLSFFLKKIPVINHLFSF